MVLGLGGHSGVCFLFWSHGHASARSGVQGLTYSAFAPPVGTRPQRSPCTRPRRPSGLRPLVPDDATLRV